MRGGEREKGGGYYRLPPVKPKRKTCQSWRGLENTVLVRSKWTGVDDDLHTVCMVYHVNKAPQGQ